MSVSSHDLFVPADLPKEGKEELAREAVKIFRTMQPTLTAYARMLTGNSKVRVEVSSTSNGHTNGEKISYRPPLELGMKHKHQRGKCDKRDSERQLICHACRAREAVLVVIYHEIAHICFGSFEKVSNRDLVAATQNGVRATEGKYAEEILKRIEAAPERMKREYMPLAHMISQWFPILLNAIEDARVNRKMFNARKGTKKMFDALIFKIFTHGVEQPDQLTGEIKNVMWYDYPLNAQMLLGVFCRASHYDVTGWFNQKVIDDLKDPQLSVLINRIDSLNSVSGSYRLGFPILARLRDLGYCVLPDDPETEEEPPEEEDSDSEQSEDAHEESSKDESESDPPQGDGQPGETGDPDESESESNDTSGEASETSEGSSGGESSSDADGEDSPGNGSGESSDPGTDGEASSESSPDGKGNGKIEEGSDESPGNGGSAPSLPPDGRGGSGSEDGPDEDLGDSDSGDDDRSGGDASSSEGDPDDGGPDGGGDDKDDETGPDDSQLEGSGQTEESTEESDLEELEASDESGTADTDPVEGDSSPVSDDREDGDHDAGDGEGSESDPGGPTGDDGSNREGTSAPEGTDAEDDDSNGQDDRGEADSSTSGEGSTPEDGSEEEDEALDLGADRGKGGASVEGDVADDLPPYGTPEDGKAALLQLGDHQDPPTINAEQIEAETEEAFGKAIIQGLYFETPSVGVYGVREHFWEKPVKVDGANVSTAWSHRSKTNQYNGYNKIEAGIDGNFEPAEHILGKALLALRRVFADNAVGGRERHKHSGRVDRRALGKRAPVGDERLFFKKNKVEKKSYFVVIGLDVSGSTYGMNLKLIKQAALAQAHLLYRMGIPFAVYAHSGNYHDETNPWASPFDMDIYHVKDAHEPWNDKTALRLTSLGAAEGNLDGHSVEYYRKVAMSHRATDRIIMYYTDGQMPAANYDEELEVLQEQIKICRRDGVTLMAVGVRTDSPIKHGFDTVTVEEDADIIKVVTHLEKRLRGR